MLLISKCRQVFVSRQHLNFKVQLKLSVMYKKAPKFKHLWNNCSLKKVLWKIPAFCIIIPNFNWILQKFHFIRLHYISRALEKSTKLLSFFFWTDSSFEPKQQMTRWKRHIINLCYIPVSWTIEMNIYLNELSKHRKQIVGRQKKSVSIIQNFVVEQMAHPSNNIIIHWKMDFLKNVSAEA